MIKNIISALAVLSLFSTSFASTGDFSPQRAGRGTIGINSSGTNFATFNNYINSCDLSYLTFQSDIDPTLRNPFPTDCNRIYADERDFATARKGGAPNPYFHSLSAPIRAGDTIRVLVWVHNNAVQGTNPARNTRVSLDLSNPTSLLSTITSSNARPRTITDRTSITNIAPGLAFELANSNALISFGNTLRIPHCRMPPLHTSSRTDSCV